MAAIVCFGEFLMRLSAPGKLRLSQTQSLALNYGGAEANVAVSMARFDHDARYITALPDNALGAAARAALMAHGVSVAGPTIEGSRIGLYFLEAGAMGRPSAIVYDRAHSAFATCPADAYDWPTLLSGADRLHLSGISLALGDEAQKATFEAAEYAKNAGVAISFDCNFRASLWKGREREAPALIRDLASRADIIIGGAKDAELLFGVSNDQNAPQESFQRAAAAFLSHTPTISIIAATHRDVHSAGSNTLSGFIADRTGFASAKPVRLNGIVDRIGAGDAFAAGLLHKQQAGAAMQDVIDFALAAAAFKHSIAGDFNLATEDEISDFMAGGTDVKR